jgi:hypothetical protein
VEQVVVDQMCEIIPDELSSSGLAGETMRGRKKIGLIRQELTMLQ